MADSFSDDVPYSVGHAIRYAHGKIRYCDRMLAEFPDARLEPLKVRATAFLNILDSDPQNLDRLRDLLSDLRSSPDGTGTGWQMLLDYVERYVEQIADRART